MANGVSINPAWALHTTVSRLIGSGEQNIQNAWQTVLGIQPGTVPFIERHTEIVGLVGLITERLNSLPEGTRQKDIYLGYVPQWYDAVVSRNSWGNTQHPPAQLLPADSLNLLAGLADYFDFTFGDSRSVLTDDAMQKLRDGLNEWRDLLVGAGIPAETVNEIRGQVDHLEWMLDNVQLVGNQPIVRGARELVGTGFSLMALKPKVAVTIGGVIMGLLTFLGNVNDGLDVANGILEGVADLTANVQELAGGEVPQKELPAAPSGPHIVPEVSNLNAGSDQNVVDAEVVDDDEAAG